MLKRQKTRSKPAVNQIPLHAQMSLHIPSHLFNYILVISLQPAPANTHIHTHRESDHRSSPSSELRNRFMPPGHLVVSNSLVLTQFSTNKEMSWKLLGPQDQLRRWISYSGGQTAAMHTLKKVPHWASPEYRHRRVSRKEDRSGAAPADGPKAHKRECVCTVLAWCCGLN